MINDTAHFLVIDQGTQSIRALVFDLNGHLVAREQLKIEAYFSTQPGWAEQEPEYFWQSLAKVCQKLWQQGIVTPGSISSMAVTTQRGSMLNLDVQGHPLRPAIYRLTGEFKESIGSVVGME